MHPPGEIERPAAPRWWRLTVPVFVAVFLLYAVNFLYFFVDDEAITFAYAQHLLRGHGFTYSVFEGPTEGYSNFLHVLLAAILLWLTETAGLSKLAVFALGKILSLAAGAAIVVIVGRTLGRLFPADWRAQLGALTVLALAGPLAVWSCSSLETVPFAALLTGFVAALLFDSRRSAIAAAALGSLLVLERIDGFIYAGVVVLAAAVVGPSARRRLVLGRVVPAMAATFLVYHAWRFWYFDSLLTLPLRTKVLFRLMPREGVVTFLPPTTYLQRFFALYHPAVLAVLALGWMPFWQRGDDRRPAFLVLSLGLLGIYAAQIGDWMFGFRFFAALFPLLALLLAYTVAALTRRARFAGTLLLAAVAGWSGFVGLRFVTAFEEADRLAEWKSWWSAPSFQAARYFAPYYPLYDDAKDRIPRGAVTINNQAGFLPFMLDLENIDDLGITSRFFATLPTADVIFTEVGRYHVLTDRKALRAGETYLLHRDAPYLISWVHMLRNTNDGHIPLTLLGGQFRLSHLTPFQVIYERTGPWRPRSIEDFRENLVHPATIGFAAMQGARIERADLGKRMSFLAEQFVEYPLAAPLQFEFHLRGDPVYQLWIDRLTADGDVDLALTLRDPTGTVVFRDALHIGAGVPLHYDRTLEQPVPGGVLTIAVLRTGDTGTTLGIGDLRVLGQTAALRRQLVAELFPDRRQ